MEATYKPRYYLKGGIVMRVCVFGILLALLSFSQTLNESDPRAIIEKVRIYRLTQELDMTTEQAMQFFPKLNELQKIENEFHNKRTDFLHQLRRLIDSGATDQAISNIIAQYETAYNEKIELQKKKMTEIRKILTPVQQAKYLIFQETFEQEIREMIKAVKERRKTP
jgi:Spy/CpxP family protein refolding chaperone